MAAALGTRPRPAAPERVLVASDLSAAGDSALRVALARAPRTGATVAVCHVLADDPAVDPAAAVEQVRAHLRDAFGSEAGAVEVLVAGGDPAEQIARLVDEWRANLVVLGRPEHPAGILRRLFRPGVVEQVVRHAPCRVLVTRKEPASGRVLIGVDADHPLPVLQAAVPEIALRNAQLVVAHWIAPAGTGMTTLSDAAVPLVSWEDLVAAALPPIEAAVRDAGLHADVRVMAGDAGRGLCELATELAADLVLVGTHGRSGLARLALGSVAEHVVNDAPCSVMVVRLDDAT